MKHIALRFFWAAVVFSLIFPASPASAGVRIKIATKAPENFASARIITEMTDKIKEETGGQVKFKIYYGGVKGTGRDLLLKMKTGEIQGGEFTAGEASSVANDLRIMNIPLIFNSYEEVDAVMAKMAPIYEEQLKKEGFVVLGWLEVGFAYIMSTEPIANLADMKGKKVWIPQGDPVGQAAFEAMGVPPIPLTIADVMVALQTGQINTVANSFVGAIALQWHTKVKYITDKPLLYVYGLTMITKDAYDKIPDAYKPVVHKNVDHYFGILKEDIRKSNAEASGTLKKEGIQFVPVTSDHYQELKGVIDKVKADLAGKEFTGETLGKMQQFLQEYRASHPAE